MPGMGLTLSPDPTPVLILAVSSAFITTIVSTTDYTLTTGDFTNGAKILYMPTDFKSNILTLQLIRKKYNYIVPEFIKCMYEYSSTDRPRAASLIPWLVQYTCTYFRINCMGEMYRQNCTPFCPVSKIPCC